MAVWRVSVLLQAESLKLLVFVLGLLKLPEPRNCEKKHSKRCFAALRQGFQGFGAKSMEGFELRAGDLG